jgi:Protein tyrosine and serine/threonine kinase
MHVPRSSHSQSSAADRDATDGEPVFMQGLRHPNIMMFCGACLEGRDMFLVTELMPFNLHDVLYNMPDIRLQPAHVLGIALDVARACWYMHSRQPQVIHRWRAHSRVLGCSAT